MSNSIEERIKEFRGDPQKMDVATKFVNEVVEKAKNEALSRMNENDAVQEVNADCGPARKRRRWHLRARGLFTRILASFCICNTETKV